ncbi:MAG: hypothetical protein J7K04_12115 [Spirochaetales bacterium]|nr:hypothetical protein [Spirochaetales bacterium]
MKNRLANIFVLITVLFLIAGSFAFGLEVRDGRIKLVLHEGTGRFSLYYLSDFKEKKYIPFFADQDPRTSVISLLIDNKIYKLGEASSFQESSAKTNNGAQFVWKSPQFEISEIFTPVSSNEAPLANGVKIEIDIKNLSEQSFSVGLRFLLDTYLGEDSYIHFKTDRVNQIVKEQTITRANMVKYWVSPKQGNADQFGLECITTGKGITVPDSIVFANWKRLNDSSWSYKTSVSRNFSLLPYSINDSAVAQYYNPENLSKNMTRKIVIVLGKYDAKGYDISSNQNKTNLNSLLKKAVSGEGISDKYLSAQADLSTVNKLLVQIDDALKSYETISNDKVEFIEEILNGLKEKSKKYSQ